MAVSTLGVTGGIGSGKSMACQYLSELGAFVFAADQAARQLMHEDNQVRKAMVRAFGPAIYLADGRLDRPGLAARVFSDSSELARLNSIVHPAVGRAFDEARSTCLAPLMVHEAALIFEANLEHRLDAVAVVTAPVEARFARVQKRDHLTRTQVQQRMANQLPQEELERRADVVVPNDESLAALRQKITLLYDLAASAQPLSRDTFRYHRRL